MSGVNTTTTSQAIVSDSKDDSKPLQPQKPAAQLEEDDEFEDFPVEGNATYKLCETLVRVREGRQDC